MQGERYAEKPLLRLLELYVLWSIAKLTEEDEARLRLMAPKLQKTFGGDGTWRDALATAMHMPGEMPELIRETWEKNLGIAADNDVTLAPQHFAEMFVDSNFAS
jgi:hypothetical protein